jgi:hypothetical protein
MLQLLMFGFCGKILAHNEPSITQAQFRYELSVQLLGNPLRKHVLPLKEVFLAPQAASEHVVIPISNEPRSKLNCL